MRTESVAKHAGHCSGISVPEMLSMLSRIHDEACGDRAMHGVAATVGSAISQLVELRRAAHAVLVEAEAEAVIHPARTH